MNKYVSIKCKCLDSGTRSTFRDHSVVLKLRDTIIRLRGIICCENEYFYMHVLQRMLVLRHTILGNDINLLEQSTVLYNVKY